MHRGFSLFRQRTADVTLSDGVETGATECVGVCEWQTRKCLFVKMSSPAHKLELKCSAATGPAEEPMDTTFWCRSRCQKCQAHGSTRKGRRCIIALCRRSDTCVQQKKLFLTARSSLTLRSLAHYLLLLCQRVRFKKSIWCGLFFNSKEFTYYISHYREVCANKTIKKCEQIWISPLNPQPHGEELSIDICFPLSVPGERAWQWHTIRLLQKQISQQN